MNMIAADDLALDYRFPGTLRAEKQGCVVLFSDNTDAVARMETVCEFLDLKLECVSAGTDLADMLRARRPMAVISDIDGDDHDGFHAMKLIARYNPDLPVMLLTDGDIALMGAADAIQEIWGLTAVTLTSGFPLAGQLVSFLFSAGRKAGCMRLVPV